MLNRKQAKKFAKEWLPSWTGNNPEKLCSYYSDDAFYLDPGVPGGIKGKENLLSYFRKLLSYNPKWIWTQIDAIPMEDGFLNKWHASIPVGKDIIECIGVCSVQLNDEGKIYRNEVYFDRSELLNAINTKKKAE